MWFARIPDDTLPEVKYSIETYFSETYLDESTSCNKDFKRDMMPKQLQAIIVQVSAVV